MNVCKAIRFSPAGDPYQQLGACVLNNAVLGRGWRLVGTSVRVTEEKLSHAESEDEVCRRAHIEALPVVVVGMAAVTIISAGRSVMQVLDDGVELVVDAINITQELARNEDEPLTKQPYEGPKNAVLRAAVGAAAAPLVLLTRFALGDNRRHA